MTEPLPLAEFGPRLNERAVTVVTEPFPGLEPVTDEALATAYAELGNVWKVGERFGIAGQTVSKRLKRAGIACNGNGNLWTTEDDERLRRDYVEYRAIGQAVRLGESMGRTVSFLSRKAKVLGLTDGNHHEKRYAGRWKYMDEEKAGALLDTFKTSSLDMGQFCAKFGLATEGFSITMRRYFADEWEHVIESKVARSSRYRQGRAVEYRIRDHLKSLGYFVLRAPASRSPIDVLAVKHGEALFVQAKRSMVIPPAEWNALFDLAISVGGRPLVAGQPSGTGLVFFELMARKDGSKRRQPWEECPEFNKKGRW